MELDKIVTVGLVVKNNENTIRYAINSVIKQKYPKKLMEIIVVNGNSNDNTIKIIQKSLSNNEVQYKILCENEGLGYARQMVVDNALGKYIIWVDGDMVLSNDFIEKQVELMEKNPNIGIAKGKYGQASFNSTLPAKLEDYEFFINTHTEGKVLSVVLGASGCIYRSDTIREIGGFNLDIKGAGEDNYIEKTIKDRGWDLYISNAVFYEKRRTTWQEIWSEYFWHGKGGAHLHSINKGFINYPKFIPFIALYDELNRSVIIYKLVYNRLVFLLPIHYLFKRLAWICGFVHNL